MRRLTILIMFYACVAVSNPANAASNLNSQFESADGYIVNYPDN